MTSATTTVPLHAADISAFCKALRQQLIEKGVTNPPSHVMLLNSIAKSAGHRNYQALRASSDHQTPLPQPLAARSGLSRAVAKAIGHFDSAGRLMRWPTQFAVQRIALWGLWCRLPAKRDLSEREVNEYLSQFHTFADNATLRRELVNMKMLWRTKDGSVYRKEHPLQSEEAVAFLKELFVATRA